MKTYPESPQAAQDLLRVIQGRKQEIAQGLDAVEAERLNECLARIRDMGGDQALEIMMRSAPLFSRELVR